MNAAFRKRRAAYLAELAAAESRRCWCGRLVTRNGYRNGVQLYVCVKRHQGP